MTSKLAIVIPYYKPQFFRDVLLSVKNQTDKRFHLYIGDDCSPNDPLEIIKEVFGNDFDHALIYYRFNYNLGRTALTKQWGRCIEMANEPYIWLFSDDDIMPADAVERFYKFVENQPDAELMRFNINVINDQGKIINPGSEHPVHETAISFLKRRLQGQCISTACEYIFKKEVYLKEGGFTELPLAWASDDATWVNFGRKTGIWTISGRPVCWRFGSFNISANKKIYKEKIKASLLFIKMVNTGYAIDKNLQLNWLFLQLGLLDRSVKVWLFFFYELFTCRMFRFGTISLFLYRKSLKKMGLINYSYR